MSRACLIRTSPLRAILSNSNLYRVRLIWPNLLRSTLPQMGSRLVSCRRRPPTTSLFLGADRYALLEVDVLSWDKAAPHTRAVEVARRFTSLPNLSRSMILTMSLFNYNYACFNLKGWRKTLMMHYHAETLFVALSVIEANLKDVVNSVRN
ncbi:hypothetical protein SERLA73DRAFT_76775 [Serpula lacrymans var. lacrymans S7.3]|uniref:Uncharacterized protein n=2 Tax=Serpula lacrymans var. lacrymans TaxID=341189 RepID=F8Q810_SERL3|nr:uncharacterized protein SERLADRAFT_441592 [Serpula lacrymans var. lacrymans S7.9]EGN95698.1 hypothetical protein SERLA73DRAFT_76775 [Serpula lacrymans var. lacrymans S7.3]EGO21224.1 hypothetical protein SERLADRAFT_441592 [Serpula lacrymans var. lacrymans S7.9]